MPEPLINRGKTGKDIVKGYVDSEEAKQAKETRAEQRTRKGATELLAYATYDPNDKQMPGKIWVYSEKTGKSDSWETTRDHRINALCNYQGKLHDAGRNGAIYESLYEKEIAKRDKPVNGLCVYRGMLIDGGNSGVFDKKGTFRLDKKFVRDICTRRGELYCAEEKSITKDDKPLHRNLTANALCIHNGNLYSAYHAAIHDVFSGNEVTERQDEIYALCSLNGVLYDAGRYGIWETFTNNPVIQLEKAEIVTALGIVTAEELLNLATANIEADKKDFMSID